MLKKLYFTPITRESKRKEKARGITHRGYTKRIVTEEIEMLKAVLNLAISQQTGSRGLYHH